MAKGDPHRGHLRPELVSPVPPGLRKAIQLETRSVSYLPADRSRRSPYVKFRLNFILLEFVLQRETGAVILEHPLEVRGALFLDLAEVFVGVEHVRLGFDHSHGDIGAVVGDPLEVR